MLAPVCRKLEVSVLADLAAKDGNATRTASNFVSRVELAA
jgi:hypothetical protein